MAKPEEAKEIKEEVQEEKKEPLKKAGKGKIAKEDVIAFIEEMTVLELSELVKELESKFGVTAAVPMAGPISAGQAQSSQPSSEAKEEAPSEFTVILSSSGEKKIQVIKEVRAITGLGLKEAKELVDGAPKPVKAGISREEADKIKKQLEAAGAAIEIK